MRDRRALEEVVEEAAREELEAAAEAQVVAVDDDLLVAHAALREPRRAELLRARGAAAAPPFSGSKARCESFSASLMSRNCAFANCSCASPLRTRPPVGSSVEIVRVGGLLVADLVDLEIERHRALAHAQRAERMQHLRALRFRQLAQRDEQVVLRRQLRAPVLRLGELALDSSGITAIGGSVVSSDLAPGDVEVRRDVEEEEADRAGAVRAVRRGPFELEIQVDAEQPHPEDLERDCRPRLRR